MAGLIPAISRLRVGGKNRPFISSHSLRHFGAGEGIRTLDPNLGKVEVADCYCFPQIYFVC
jgi:hypothetical protein